MISLFVILILSVGFLFLDSKSKSYEVDEELLEWISGLNDDNDSLLQLRSGVGVERFQFDPNIVSKEELLSLGFSERASDNLLKYRKAGGQIKSFQKLRTIYGMDSAHLEEIRPLIVIDKGIKNNKVYSKKGFSYKVDLNTLDSSALLELKLVDSVLADITRLKKQYYFKRRIDRDSLRMLNIEEWHELSKTLLFPKQSSAILSDEFLIELNVADTAELALLKGVGRVYARRIVYYRNKLGGFYSPDQLLEVEGISPVILNDNANYLAVDSSKIKKININTASLKRMKEHPYMNFYMAKDIYEARKENWPVNLESMMKSVSFSKADHDRIRLYFCDSE